MEAPMTKTKVLAELHAAWVEWDALMRQVQAARGREAFLEGGVAGDWSVRDLVAHLTSYDRWFVHAAEAQLRGEPPPLDGTEWLPWDERNAIHHQRTLYLSLDEVMAASTQTYTRLRALVEQLDEAFLIEPQQPPGMAQPFVVWEQLRGNHYDHRRQHARQVQTWLER
jgi:hypothetical protein